MARIRHSKLGEPDNNPQSSQPQDAKQSFFDHLRQMTEQDWDNHLVYVYRRWPRISRSDQPHYIDTVRQAIDEQWLLEHHGSGKYSLRLNDKRRTIDSYVCEVHDLNHPPKVQPEELVDCPENDRYAQLWPQVPNELAGDDAEADIGPVATAVRELGKIAREKPALDKTLASLYLETAKSRDALVERFAGRQEVVVDQISTLEKILGLVERLQGKERNIDQLAVVREMMATVRELQGVGSSNATPNMLGQAKELAEAMQTFRELFGGSEGQAAANAKETDWWQGLLNTKAAEALAGSIGQVATAVTLKMMETGGKHPRPGITTAPVPPVSTGAKQPGLNISAHLQSPQAAAPSQPKQDAGVQPQPPIPTATQQSSQQLVNESIAQNIFPFVIQALTDSIPGDELAASVFTLNKLAYAQLHGQGEAGLLQILQTVPEYWGQLLPLEPQVRQLIHDFIAWNDQTDDDGDIDTQPANSKSDNR